MNAAAELTVHRAGEFACVRVEGRANFACAPGFKRALWHIIDAKPACLIVDLAECVAMDSTFLGVLSGGAERYHRECVGARHIELLNAIPRIAGLIESLGVQDLFRTGSGEPAVPPEALHCELDVQNATKIELKEISLEAHERLIELNEGNKQRFAELIRLLKEDLDKLKAGAPPALPGFEIAAWNQQADEVGGDFHDFAPRAGLRAAVLIADVCGKSVSAATIALRCRPILRQELAAEHGPATVMKRGLMRIVPCLPEDTFITALCVVLDSVSHSFRMARAGHDPMLWFHAGSRTVALLSPKGMALGIERAGLSEATFVEKEQELAPGDVLLLHTDGITEALNPEGEEFGCARLGEVLSSAAALDAGGIVEKVRVAVNGFTQDAPPHDDRTLIVIKAL